MNFTKPENLDGAKLRLELRAAGVDISDRPEAISLVDNELTLDIKVADKTAATNVLKAHKG